MDAVFFIIFISMFAVAILLLLAFFPIKVSWFYYSGKSKIQRPAKIQKQHSSYKNNYTKLDDDSFDDPEL